MASEKKICIITGATGGIGRETAKKLASGNIHLALPVRDLSGGNKLRDEILEENPGAVVELYPCNLASFGSIREFTQAFRRKHNKLHLLINNAGVWETRRSLSDDGIEMTFAVNHLAPFLLTHLLLDAMKNSAPARIINVASEAHRQGHIHFDDPEFEKKYSALGSYAQSKLANILFTKKLSQLLRGSDITANCLHPGFVNTNLFKNFPGILPLLMYPFMISPEKGAKTTLYLATSAEVAKTGGEYFSGSKPRKPAAEALRQDVADRLWSISQTLTGI